MEEIASETRTIIIYEAPHHLRDTLDELYGVLGDRDITLCRELTKKHEEKEKVTLASAIEIYKTKEPKGEYVLILAGKSKEQVESEKQALWEDISIEDHYQRYIDEGRDKKDAMKAVAKDRGLSKRDVYQALL